MKHYFVLKKKKTKIQVTYLCMAQLLALKHKVLIDD